jgi:hypothetical protein
MRPVCVFSLCIGLFISVSCQDRSKSGNMGTFNVGEHVQAGPLIYTVVDTQWYVSLGEDDSQRVPVNRFLTVNLTVVNGGGKEELPVPSVSLIDDSGQVYPELENGAGVAGWMGSVRKVRPADTATGNLLFDVPQRHFKLKVADENEQHYAFVDIPLNFGVPPVKVEDVPAPAQPRLATPK